MAKTASNAAPKQITSGFKLTRETKGAYVYSEVDEKGEPVEQVFANVGTFYVRKTAIGKGVAAPAALTMTLTY